MAQKALTVCSGVDHVFLDPVNGIVEENKNGDHIMADLRKLENNYPKDYRTTFEELSTLIFCVTLGLTQSVNRRVSQKGIESDPITINNKTYAYQAKYFDAATRLSKKKSLFIKSIKEARKKGVTDLFFFINKDLTQSSTDTDKEPEYIQDIDAEAKGNGEEHSINIEWWTLSKIESSLDLPNYQFIKSIYLEDSYAPFYEEVYKQFSEKAESEIYGDISFPDFYIEPTIDAKDELGNYLSVHEYLEKFVSDDTRHISVICGEPGHGKTSLCQKAMCDFYNNGWLSGKVKNVFCFSLNPANTKALDNGNLYLYHLLSWGDDRQNPEQNVDKKGCNDSLIFFDAFDELLEWCPDLDLESFIRDNIIPFQKNTGSHIVITSRKMAVEPGIDRYDFGRRIHVSIHQLQLITRENQLHWIRSYIVHCRKYLFDSMNEYSSKQITQEEINQMEEYLKQYEEMTSDDSFQQILGIPIIFRMIVMARYLPQRDQFIPQIYDKLFHRTWLRHKHRKIDKYHSRAEQEKEIRRKLSHHALCIYADNNETAVISEKIESAWLYSFYTSHSQEKDIQGTYRIGFLHRSFYQYFLAEEILSWFLEYKSDDTALKNKLSYLSIRRLDKTVLDYIKELYELDSVNLNNAEVFDRAHKMLKDTDGIYELLRKNDISEEMQENNSITSIISSIQKINPIERANNIFWNVISICSVCGKPLTRNKINEGALSIYNMDGSVLDGAVFRKIKLYSANFARASLIKANFYNADLPRAYFRDAKLKEAIFQKAKLRGASFRFAVLCKADFRGADLTGADLRGSDFTEADLRGVNLNGVIITGANLYKAKILESEKRKWLTLGVATSMMTLIQDSEGLSDII